MAHLNLDKKLIDQCREMAARISQPVEQLIETHSTVAIERATLRLLGVEGAVQQAGQWFPQANVIIEDLRKERVLDQGILHWFVNGMIQTKMPARELAEEVASRKVNLLELPRSSEDLLRKKALSL